MKRSASGISVFFVMLSILCSSQPTAQWVKSFGNPSMNWGTAICTDNAGNTYIGGIYNDSMVMCNNNLPVTLPGDTKGNLIIARLDPLGNCVWVKTGRMIDNTGSVLGFIKDMKVHNGSLYLIGVIASRVVFDNDTLINGNCIGNNYGAIVFKMDLNGNYIWKKVLRTGCGYSWPQGFSPIGNSLYVCGIYQDSLEVDNVKLKTPFSEGSFLLKMTNAGTGVWAINTGTPASAAGPMDMTSDGKSSLFVTGYIAQPTLSFPNSTLTNAPGGGDGSFIAKYDTSGVFGWAVGGNTLISESVFNQNIEWNCTGLFFKGQAMDSARFSTSTYTIKPNHSRDLIVRLSLTGQFQWSRLFGRQNGYPFESQIHSCPDGVISYGSVMDTAVVGANTVYANPGPDHLIVKLDNSGNYNWYKHFGGGVDEISMNLHWDNGILSIISKSRSNYTVDGIPVTNPSASLTLDMVVARFPVQSTVTCPGTATTTTTTAGTGDFDQQQALLLYPNPSTGKINIDANSFGKAGTFQIFDLLGKMVRSETIAASDQISVDLYPGSYLFVFRCSDATITRKIIVLNE